MPLEGGLEVAAELPGEPFRPASGFLPLPDEVDGVEFPGEPLPPLEVSPPPALEAEVIAEVAAEAPVEVAADARRGRRRSPRRGRRRSSRPGRGRVRARRGRRLPQVRPLRQGVDHLRGILKRAPDTLALREKLFELALEGGRKKVALSEAETTEGLSTARPVGTTASRRSTPFSSNERARRWGSGDGPVRRDVPPRFRTSAFRYRPPRPRYRPERRERSRRRTSSSRSTSASSRAWSSTLPRDSRRSSGSSPATPRSRDAAHVWTADGGEDSRPALSGHSLGGLRVRSGRRARARSHGRDGARSRESRLPEAAASSCRPAPLDESALFSDEQEFFNFAGELQTEMKQESDAAGAVPRSAAGDVPLEEIFREFKKGVEQQLSPEDYETHYNLGIAYKEMSLTDEAISEFQRAAKSPQYAVECCSMLGLCFLEKGLPAARDQVVPQGARGPEHPRGRPPGPAIRPREHLRRHGRPRKRLPDVPRDLRSERRRSGTSASD